jgi:hypothetical protein
MTLYVSELQKIQDGRQHPPETFLRFRRLLTTGVAVQADPKRPDFYELRCGSEVFYFYLSPVSGEVLLLAVWADGTGRPLEIC